MASSNKNTLLDSFGIILLWRSYIGQGCKLKVTIGVFRWKMVEKMAVYPFILILTIKRNFMIAAHEMSSNHEICYYCLDFQECFNEEFTFTTAGDTYHVAAIKIPLTLFYLSYIFSLVI